jgi:2-amino-4-hydroxy-6-hydroxymethyldihydropteridine diphosphokinase
MKYIFNMVGLAFATLTGVVLAEGNAEANQIVQANKIVVTASRVETLLATTPEVEVDAVSRVYETDPVGPPQGDYLNAIARIRCGLGARGLLARLLEIEAECGRDRAEAERWEPRLLDLDLLLFGAEEIHEAELEVPHPRLHERAFVLVPFCDVGAEVIHPTQRTSIRELADRIGDAGVRCLESRLDG